MNIQQMGITGAFVLTPRTHTDDRGLFFEVFKSTVVNEAIGSQFHPAQVNCSVSRAGALRGIHFADVPPGQAKFVTCITGAVFDVIVDLRCGSPTFGQWQSVVLDGVSRRCVYLAEGLGHAFMSLADDSAVTYLCSTEYNPSREHTVYPCDPQLSIQWPADLEPQLSSRDLSAPTLDEARQAGLLPEYRPTHSDI
jgi:dTDP-4-dehydrorhamnose 3,5-epimerase